MWLRFTDRGQALQPGSAQMIGAMLLGALLLCHGCAGSGSARRPSPQEPETALGPLVTAPVQAAYDRALAAMAGGNLVEAELALEQFVLEYPHLVGAYVNLAIVYERDNRHDEAHAVLDQALSINPTHAPANNQLGILLRKQGQFAEAEQAYRRAIDAEPEYALAHHNLGVLLDLYLQRPADALEHYQRYQDSLAEPDAAVARWIIDLRRRLGITDDTAARVVQEESS